MRTLYGINPVMEQLRTRPDEIDKLFIAQGSKLAPELIELAKAAGVRIEPLPRDKLAAMAEGGVHQGVVCRVPEFKYAELSQLLAKETDGRPSLVVVLDGIQDPQNLGAIARSALAFGATGLVIPKDRAVGVTGVAMKSAVGALSHLPVARVTNVSRALDELKEAGFWTAAAVLDGDRDLPQADLSGPMALVIGAEGEGVRQGVAKSCDFRIRIPMHDQKVGSLNASAAGAVLLYELHRQRMGGGKLPMKRPEKG